MSKINHNATDHDSVKRDMQDMRWWQKQGKMLGWTLSSYTYRSGATFFTDDPKERNPQRLSVSSTQMKSIVDAIKGKLP